MSKEIKIIVLLVVTIGLLNLDQFTRFSPVLMNRLKCFINFIKKCNYNEQISESIEDEEKREREWQGQNPVTAICYFTSPTKWSNKSAGFIELMSSCAGRKKTMAVKWDGNAEESFYKEYIICTKIPLHLMQCFYEIAQE